MSLAAINVTGPLAEELLVAGRAGRAAPLPRPRPRRRRRRALPRHAPVVHRRGGVRAAPPGRPLGRAVAGADGPSAPTSASGRTASRRCSGCGSRRATSSSGWTPSSTPRRAGSGWTGRSGWTSRAFIGRAALERTGKLPDHRRWLGFTMDGPAPVEGAPIWSGGEIVGNVTGSWDSPLLGQGADARLAAPDAVRRPGRDRRPRGRRHADAVLRSGGRTVPALEPLRGLRVVADPGAPSMPRAGAGDGRRSSCGSRPTRRSSIGATRRRPRRPARHRRGRGRLRRGRRLPARRRRAPHRVAAPAERRALAQGADRGRPGQGLAWLAATATSCSSSSRPTPTSSWRRLR